MYRRPRLIQSGIISVSNTKERLDEKVWEQLPEELLLLILPYLPWDDIVGLRCTCKKWLSTFQDQKFLQMYTQIRAQVPIGIVSVFTASGIVKSNWSYSIASGGTHRRSDSVLLSRPVPLSFPPLSFSDYTVINCAESFIFLWKVIADRVGVVVNPMNGTLRQIRMDFAEEYGNRFIGSFIGIVMYPGSGGYRILAESCSTRPGDRFISYHLYDSLSKSWTKMFDSRSMSIYGNFRCPVYCEGDLYCLSKGKFFVDRPDNRSGCEYSVYRAKECGWARLAGKMPHFLLGFPCLFSYRGHLMLAAGIVDCEEILCSVHIWKFNAEIRSWVEMQRMPDSLLKRLLQISMPSCSHANGDYLCFGEKIHLVHSSSKKSEKLDVVMFNMSTKTWSLLSNLSSVGRCPMGLFVPSLEAIP